ncbi:hypothetical protein ACWC1B_49795, partial [Streptomyces phaeochromogenes]
MQLPPLPSRAAGAVMNSPPSGSLVRSFAYCNWHEGFSDDARLVQLHDQGSAFGARGLFACAACRKLHRLVPVADRQAARGKCKQPSTTHGGKHVTTIQEHPGTDARTLLSADIRATLVSNMRDKFPHLTEEKADRGVGQMLAFLAACNYAGRPLSPSPLVDDFWHAFLLHT